MDNKGIVTKNENEIIVYTLRQRDNLESDSDKHIISITNEGDQYVYEATHYECNRSPNSKCVKCMCKFNIDFKMECIQRQIVLRSPFSYIYYIMTYVKQICLCLIVLDIYYNMTNEMYTKVNRLVTSD